MKTKICTVGGRQFSVFGALFTFRESHYRENLGQASTIFRYSAKSGTVGKLRNHSRHMKTQLCTVADVGDGFSSLPILKIASFNFWRTFHFSTKVTIGRIWDKCLAIFRCVGKIWDARETAKFPIVWPNYCYSITSQLRHLLIKLISRRFQPSRFGRKPPVFGEYFRSPPPPPLFSLNILPVLKLFQAKER